MATSHVNAEGPTVGFVRFASAFAGFIAGAEGEQEITLTVWHSFAAESQEEAVFFDAIAEFELTHPHIQVEVTGIPFADIDRQYEIAAQAGQAPDIVRLSSDQLGKIGEIRVNGYPLLEDLRPHLTPFERSTFDEKALQSMRYGDALYGLPASQDCLSLLYNRALFDAEGLAYPNPNWTTNDLISAAENLTQGDVYGLAIPVKAAYWWFLSRLDLVGNSLIPMAPPRSIQTVVLML